MHVPMDIAQKPAELVRVNRYMAEYVVTHFYYPKDRAEVNEILVGGVVIVVAHDQLLATVKTFECLERTFAEQHVTQMPHCIVRVDCVIPSAHQFVVMLFDCSKRSRPTLELNDFLVSEVGVGNYKHPVVHINVLLTSRCR